jgi:hypothetical protein
LKKQVYDVGESPSQEKLMKKVFLVGMLGMLLSGTSWAQHRHFSFGIAIGAPVYIGPQYGVPVYQQPQVQYMPAPYVPRRKVSVCDTVDTVQGPVVIENSCHIEWRQQ